MALRPSGFVEYSPSEQLKFDQLVDIIKGNYEKFWYTHINTPAVEANSVLLSKNGEETGKQIFGLYGLAQGTEDIKDYSLHFDLTVPFARYVLDRESELTFPFKRFQMQPVWRGERAQKGRFREFVQCDIDVIRKKDTGSDHLFYDAEIIFTLSQTLNAILAKMDINDRAIMHISNRKLTRGFLESILTDKQIAFVIPLIDKFKKIWWENFKSTLQERDVSSEAIQKICEFIEIKCTSQNIEMLAGYSSTPLFQEGYSELVKLTDYIEMFNTSFNLACDYIVDMQIIRGLDYYTGTVFEGFLEQDEVLGSICWWGRYGELTGYIDPKKNFYAWVGWSIGISRLLAKCFEKTSETQNTIAEYLFVNFDETLPDILRLVSKFQTEGKKTEVYPSSDKLGKQFWLADKRNIPYVVILGEGEKKAWIYKIKEMNSWVETTIPLD